MGLRLRRIGLLCAIASIPACGASNVAPLPLRVVADVPLPGDTSRFDYASLDPSRQLLFIAHLGASEVLAFDTHAQKVVARIPGIAEVHGVLAIPGLHRVYASATGTNEVVAIDETELRVVARMPGGRYPDGMAYAPDAGRLFVSDETGATETVIDVRSNRRIATIPLGGEVGNSQYDPVTRHIFVNVQSRAQLVEMDPASERIAARIELPGARGNHGLLIDPRRRLAFIACEGNDKLFVLDLDTRRINHEFDVGGGPDVVAEDETSGLVYVASESGVVSLFKATAGAVTKVGEGSLAPNAHVVAVDAETGRAYFPIRNLGGHPALRIVEPDRR